MLVKDFIKYVSVASAYKVDNITWFIERNSKLANELKKTLVPEDVEQNYSKNAHYEIVLPTQHTGGFADDLIYNAEIQCIGLRDGELLIMIDMP